MHFGGLQVLLNPWLIHEFAVHPTNLKILACRQKYSWWSNREKGLSRAEPSLCLRTSVNDRLESPPINEEPTPASILSFLP